MPYTIKPKIKNGFGSFGVLAGDAHEALDIVKGMVERGIVEIEVLDDNGAPYDIPQLYHIASEGESAAECES